MCSSDLNGQWIRRLGNDELLERLRPFYERAAAAGTLHRSATDQEIAALILLIRERIPLLSSAIGLTDFFFAEELRHDAAALVPKRWDADTTVQALAAARPAIADLIGEGDQPLLDAEDPLEARLRALAETSGWKSGDLFMALRVAVTGKTATPPDRKSTRLNSSH